MNKIQELCADVCTTEGWKRGITVYTTEIFCAAIRAIPQEQIDKAGEAVADISGLPAVIAGALFDFAGFLTTRKESMSVGASEMASPMAEAIKEFAKLRELPIDDAAVLSWQEWLRAAPDTPQVVGRVHNDGFKGEAWLNSVGRKLPDNARLYAAPAALPEGERERKVLRNMAARFAACLWAYHDTCPECGGRKSGHMPVCAKTYEREFKGPQDTTRVFLLTFEHDLAAAQGERK